MVIFIIIIVINEKELEKDLDKNILPCIRVNNFSKCDCKKILLVDDEPLNLLILSEYLASIHIEVDKAENGRIALDLIVKKNKDKCCQSYSIIMMDINMPVMNGILAIENINKLINKGIIQKCPIIAVTAAAGLGNSLVYDEYISKGFTELST